MSEVFFRDLRLPAPTHQLGLGGLSPAKQLGRMVEALAEIYERQQPDAVIVYGDTTSTLAGALAASLCHVPIAHVEAGLRSFNRRMPEEINRVTTDHLATWLFCPSDTSVKNLAREGITDSVWMVGDVMIDALTQTQAAVTSGSAQTLRRWELTPQGYYLATVHRAENTLSAQEVARLLRTFEGLDRPAVLPLHPRTREVLRAAGWRAPMTNRLRLLPPVSYPDMLILERSARAILTDSGGVQKEAYFWGVPCITLRNETEWVETVATGWNRLVGTQPGSIRAALEQLPDPVRARPRPVYGRGNAATKLVNVLFAALQRDRHV